MDQPSDFETSAVSSSTLTAPSGDDSYRLLRVYAHYRVLLSGILLLLFSGELAKTFLGSQFPRLFFYTIVIYGLSNIATLVLLWKKHFAPNNKQIIAILVVDITAITLLMFASSGMDVGYLMLVSVAAGSIFLQGRTTLALAGGATILVLIESTTSNYLGISNAQSLFAAAIFGVLLFSTAYAFNLLSEKIRRSNLEAESQAKQAAYLERLSQLIVERMRTGIVVVSVTRQIILINKAARELLAIPEKKAVSQLPQIPLLETQFQQWLSHPQERTPYLRASSDGPEIRVNFAQLEPLSTSDILIFIEDNRQLSQQAQQLKLASLGRLTASIAHEVRNPLGAISHAAQLLSESPDVTAADKRLGEIIKNHSSRVNHIIENVLELSRRKAATPQLVDLGQWLHSFTQEYQQTRYCEIKLHINQADISTRLDKSQFHQVLTNLCDNGLRYSKEQIGRELVTIEAGVDSESNLPYIEVIDEGVGIAEDAIDQVFEPFFTTESTGSGLGLYISRELCEANQASLDYKRTIAGKSCFRITLAPPERVF